MSNEKQSKPQNALPEVKRTLVCPQCETETEHALAPHPQGAAFYCAVCKHLTKAFTQAQMAETVMRQVFNLPAKPIAVPIPPGLQVYLEHHGPEMSETAVSELSIQNHVELTGQLPVVGKPLYAPVAGHRAFAIPYGKVVRVELPE